MMLTIPITAIPAQTFDAKLGGQNCTITIRQKDQGLFIDLAVNSLPVVSGVICRNLNRIVRYGYLGFIGDLCFVDTQGNEDPDYSGLGDRWVLMYLAEGE